MLTELAAARQVRAPASSFSSSRNMEKPPQKTYCLLRYEAQVQQKQLSRAQTLHLEAEQPPSTRTHVHLPPHPRPARLHATGTSRVTGRGGCQTDQQKCIRSPCFSLSISTSISLLYLPSNPWRPGRIWRCHLSSQAQAPKRILPRWVSWPAEGDGGSPGTGGSRR